DDSGCAALAFLAIDFFDLDLQFCQRCGTSLCGRSGSAPSNRPQSVVVQYHLPFRRGGGIGWRRFFDAKPRHTSGPSVGCVAITSCHFSDGAATHAGLDDKNARGCPNMMAGKGMQRSGASSGEGAGSATLMTPTPPPRRCSSPAIDRAPMPP